MFARDCKQSTDVPRALCDRGDHYATKLVDAHRSLAADGGRHTSPALSGRAAPAWVCERCDGGGGGSGGGVRRQERENKATHRKNGCSSQKIARSLMLRAAVAARTRAASIAARRVAPK